MMQYGKVALAAVLLANSWFGSSFNLPAGLVAASKIVLAISPDAVQLATGVEAPLVDLE